VSSIFGNGSYTLGSGLGLAIPLRGTYQSIDFVRAEVAGLLVEMYDQHLIYLGLLEFKP
jgi:hypothetical protein